MICPICETEMERGLMQSSGHIGWIKGDERTIFYNPDFFEGSVVLSKASFIKGAAVVAHNCRRCKKIIIDYGDPTSDLNYSQLKAKE